LDVRGSNSGRSWSHLAVLKLLPFGQSHYAPARRPLAPAVLGLRSSRSVANLIPPEMNTI